MLTLTQFSPLVGAAFALHIGAEAPLRFTLVEAQPLAAQPGASRAPFVLVFEGPAEPQLSQSTYGLTHPALGPAPLDIFLVPVASGPAGRRYEAVFN